MEDNTATPSSCDDKEPSNQEHTGQRRSQSRQAKQDRLATAEATRDRKGDKLERKRLSDRRSQRLVRERNKLEFQMMKEKLEAFQASDTNVEIKRLLEENDQLKRNNRKLQDSINAVVGLLSPNGPENRITSEAKEKTTTSNMALSTNKCQDRAAEGDMDRPFIAQQTSDMLRSGPAWDDSVPAPASDAGTSESGGIQLQEVPSYESRGAYAFQQASAFLIPTIKSRSLHLHDFMQDRQHTLDGSQRNANADASAGVVQADASQQHINSYDPWGNLDHEFIALSNFNGRDSDVPAMIPYDPFNSLQIPLELVYKTCVTMITRQHELKEAHSAQWYNIWVIKEIEAHRRLSREEFDASLPEKPCLGALLQPLRCQRDLSKKIAASVLKFFSGAPFAEMIAIYCMIHSLFRVSLCLCLRVRTIQERS